MVVRHISISINIDVHTNTPIYTYNPTHIIISYKVAWLTMIPDWITLVERNGRTWQNANANDNSYIIIITISYPKMLNARAHTTYNPFLSNLPRSSSALPFPPPALMPKYRCSSLAWRKVFTLISPIHSVARSTFRSLFWLLVRVYGVLRCHLHPHRNKFEAIKFF